MSYDDGWAFLILLAVFAMFINVAWRLLERLLDVRRVPKEHAEWTIEVKQVLTSLVDNEINHHNLLARFAHLVGKQPPEYDGLAREAFARTLLMSPAIAAKAEQVGLFERGTFERLGVPDYGRFNPVADTRLPPPPAVPQLQLVQAKPEQPAPRTTFIGTVQVVEQ